MGRHEEIKEDARQLAAHVNDLESKVSALRAKVEVLQTCLRGGHLDTAGDLSIVIARMHTSLSRDASVGTWKSYRIHRQLPGALKRAYEEEWGPLIRRWVKALKKAFGKSTPEMPPATD